MMWRLIVSFGSMFAFWRFTEIQKVCFVWKDDAAMAAHNFTNAQMVGEIWAAAYYVVWAVGATAVLMYNPRDSR